MFIYVGCAGGGTSSMFCKKIVDEINQADENLTAVFDDFASVDRKQNSYGEMYDLVFAYGSIDQIRFDTAFEMGNLFDVVFVAPQVRYLTPKKQEILEDYPTLVRDIEMKIFGTMNGPVAYENLLDQLIHLDFERGAVSKNGRTTKNRDKDIELFILGGDRKDAFFKKMFSYWESFGIRTRVESYSLQTLYDFSTEEEFDLRILFGNSSHLSKEEFPKFAKRIDGLLVSPLVKTSLMQRQEWLDEYKIAAQVISNTDYMAKSGDKAGEELLTFLEELMSRSEYTTEPYVAALEQPEPLKKRKSLFGLISWS